MGSHRLLIHLSFVLTCIYVSNGCQLEGVSNLPLPVSVSFLDTFRGTILNRTISEIEGINAISNAAGVNLGPYVDFILTTTHFAIVTNNAFENYEEFETSDTFSITVTFACTGSSTRSLVFVLNVIDTNNNAPRFTPSNEIEFTIAPPVPPGYVVTGCLNDIIARDIDLTTQRVEFTIEENPYFEIAYDAASSTTAKEFKATLRTTSLIRSFPEPVTLTITATDVDLTGDPPLTTAATLKIIGDTEFQFPEELVFSQAFYLANYTTDNQIAHGLITLEQGYDEQVQFVLEGEYSNNFVLNRNGGQISLSVTSPVPTDVYVEKHILLVVRASREYTSGATTTIIVQLPEATILEFERVHYEGNIINNTLQIPQINLTQGYADSSLTVFVRSEYSQYFMATLQGNVITLTMSPLSEGIIEDNNYIYLEIVASTDRSTASTIVTLEIIKDDNVTPVFNSPLYMGTYNATSGLSIEQIIIEQGYDETVYVHLEGIHASYFQLSQAGAVITLLAPTIPVDLYAEQHILLTIAATKPRTVGANAVIIINLPAARELRFDSETEYRGSLQDTEITLSPITLVEGYDDTVFFSLTGGLANYFTIMQIQNQVVIELATPLTDEIILTSNNIILTLTALGLNAVARSVTIVLDIIKQDTNTPVFSRNIYEGTYNTSFEVEAIYLSQGHDESVAFSIYGDHAQYFEVSNTGNNVHLSLQSTIPEELILNEKFLSFNILAEKNWTVGANAAVIIRFPLVLTEPAVMRFSQNNYVGTIQNNTVDIGTIILEVGYALETVFLLSGDYASYFSLSNNNNSVSVSLSSSLQNIPEDTNFILLDLTAQRERAIPTVTTLIFEVIKEYIEPPVFGAPFYRGLYGEQTGLQFQEEIYLSEGHDETVTFLLDGDLSVWFSLVQYNVTTLTLSSIAAVPVGILENNNQLLFTVIAIKPNANNARAVISLDVIKTEIVPPIFSQPYYTGSLTEESGLLFTDSISLSFGYDETVSLQLVGDDAQWFALQSNGMNNFTITMLAVSNVENRNHLVFSVQANKTQALPGEAAIIISFEDFYTQSPLTFTQDIYNGIIDNDNLSIIGEIRIQEGGAENLTYSLNGDHSNYFQITNLDGLFILELSGQLPDDVTSANNILVFSLVVHNERSRTHATIILEIEKITDTVGHDDFDKPYYTGTYDETYGLVFTSTIFLSRGYDENVTFHLEGDDAQYFGLVRSGNSLNLTLTSPIPAAVLANNRKLIFVVTAQRAGSTTARSTIVVSLIDEYTEGNVLGFDRVTYVGSIENNVATVQSITLSEGYNANVVFSLHGELANYFSVSNVGSVVTIALQSAIPEQDIPTSGVVILEIQASSPSTLPAYATVILELITDDDSSEAVEISFAETYYTGTYTEQGGLTFANAITLSEGYDDSVLFALEGDDAQYFGLVRSGNSLNLTLTSPIPAAVLANNRKLIFVVTAQRAGSTTARSTIVVSLIDEYTEGNVLGFDRVTYVGSIENNVATVQSITLSEGYNANVVFSLHGELANYFSVSNVGSVVTIALQSAIPEQAIPTSGVVILEIQASSPSTLPAYATVILELITDNDSSEAVEISFAETYYTGTYTEQGGLTFANAITLSEGYDDSVLFALEGDDAQYFGLVRSGNSLNLTLTSPIPAAVLANNRKLIFVVTAQRAGSTTARSTIVVSLIDEYTEGNVLGFDRVTYVGSIENNVATVQSITLSEGYNANVVFSLHGELANYFSVSNVGSVVTIALQSAIPEQDIPTSGVVILEIQASSPSTLPAYATVILELITDDDSSEAVEISFAETYYTGTYTEQGGLTFANAITLSEGYDDSVLFALEGDDAQYFGLVRSGNSLNLTLTSPIPAAVLANNRKLIFVVTAQRAGSTTARSSIVISLIDEYTEGNVLGFDRVTYVGSIENNVATVQSITLSEGYNANVVFSLHGELANYFSVSNVGSVVTIALQSAIPEQAILTSGVVILEIQASSPSTLPAYATVILELITDDDSSEAVEISFAETYYTGTYTEQGGLTFANAITLSEGYDDSVLFALEGDDAQYFGLVRSGNSLNLTLTSPIPAAVLANNRKLIFVVTAQRAGSTTARSTIVISLIDEYTEGNVLGFDRVTYVGSIENNVATVQSITLSEGYNANVVFSLHGELANYFSVSNVGSVVTIALQSAIPEQAIPTSGVVILEIQASSPSTLPAYATVILELITDDDSSEAVEISFAETYYTGTYTEQGGLTFANAITLSEGYDDSVLFALEGDDAQYFGLLRSGNSLNLTLTSPIPAAVLANNRKLIFVVTAQRAGSTTARSTIVVSLIDEYTEGNVLGFDRVTYVGSIENNVATVQSITLSEGYNANVVFSLHGELANYFSVSNVGSVVTIALQSAIPEQDIPTSGVVILEIQASSPSTLPAYATVILELITDDDSSEAVEISFAETYYTGTYTEQGGLTFANAITLSEGYDDSVLFALEGDDAQYFGLVRSGNSLNLTLTSPIPAAVLANNRKLIFVVTAQRAGSTTARSTIVVSLIDEYTEGNVLGFDRVTYVGSIENNVATVQSITLSEGYNANVVFSLHGELANYFSVSNVGSVVTIALQSAIPEQAIPTSGVVILEIQASSPSTLPAYATVILELITDDDSSEAVEISFAETYYTGTYTEQGGLTFANAITLSEGYDDSVLFALEGDDAQYFGLVRSGNSLNLTLTSPIPAAVLANNRKLIFVVTAQRAGSTTARSTIVVSLIDEYTEGNVLGFDRVTYVGSIENNVATVQSITLSEGYNANVVFSLHGELANYFSVSNVGSVVTIALQSAIPEQAIPTSGVVILEIQASSPSTLPAYATVILELITDDDSSEAVEISFAETYYTGTYTEQGGLTFANAITLSEGYDESVSFYLDGGHSDLFILTGSGNSLVLALLGTIPAEIIDMNEYIILIVTARRPGSSAQATVIITLPGGTNEGIISFERILYEGIIQLGVVQHEPITISGYTGTNIQIFGEYSNAFVALLTNGVVTVQTGSVTLPAAVTLVTLELRAGGASAVLILTVLESAIPVLPSVTFGSVSYALQVEVDQTGLVGRVEATADNGETITYTVITDSAHLQTRLSISNGGELHLSAPVDIDVYNFQVMGSTTITQVSATAPVHLTVNAVTVCGDNNIVTPPLIILNRDEEESHNSLVVINGTQFQGCRYSLVNRWPVDQSWLYVDETGLHTRAIDREHESIAFMAQSQVQVELTLYCESDQIYSRSRRSLDTPWLGPYDYGTKDWILSDTILYNSRRSLVNLIVNDINDNAPVFVGKENEPIAVGYPIPELEETILPRSLAELKATDADIGENAELRYWSTDPQLAVAPSTGFVHVRSGARLEHDARLIVLATDRNGDGLSGSIQLQVKLLDDRNIVVVTVRDAFLDDEEAIVREMSAAVGYEVKVLRSVVISDDVETINTRNNRDTIPAGASLQLYAYGLMEREPVEIEQLITDINNNAAVMVNVASILSLEDHLEGQEICVIPGRDTGLLVATIVLSILLFILIVLIVIWVFRKRLCRNKYEEFSDENSLASRNDSMAQLPKPEIMTKPRLDIEELKRSERRLQDMLNAPITENAIQPSTARMDPPVDAVVDMTQVDARAPIVIQSIDKLKDAEDDSSEDEFGERPKPRRKSVVTFNENVEKIIHVDDNEDISPDPDYEVYKL